MIMESKYYIIIRDPKNGKAMLEHRYLTAQTTVTSHHHKFQGNIICSNGKHRRKSWLEYWTYHDDMEHKAQTLLCLVPLFIITSISLSIRM